MNELFIHIGVHKTGTSAIQHFMDNNRDVLLREYNLYYPEVVDDSHWFQHNYLANCLKKGDGQRIDKFIKEAIDISDRLLLSSESFSGAATIPNGLKLVKDSFDSVKIIAYVRRQDLWLESVYRQLIKNKRLKITDTFDLWVDKFLNDSSALYSCDWMKLLTKWSKVFGTENIIVRPYEKTQFFGGDLIKDFLSILNINYYKEEFLGNVRTYNKSYNLEATEFLRLMNNSSNIKRWRSALNILFTNPYRDTDEVYLTHDKRWEIINRFQGSNNKVVETFLPSEKGLFTEPLPEKENYPLVFQGLNQKNIIPEIELIIEELKHAKEQLEQQKGEAVLS